MFFVSKRKYLAKQRELGKYRALYAVEISKRHDLEKKLEKLEEELEKLKLEELHKRRTDKHHTPRFS